MSFQNLKALLVVLAIQLSIFYLVKASVLKFSDQQAYQRRITVWAMITCLAFIAPSALIYFLTATLSLIFFARQEKNPLALYFMLFLAVPPFAYRPPDIAGIGLFDFTHLRMLSLGILVPALIRKENSSNIPKKNSERMKIIIILFAAIPVLLNFENSTITHTLRQAVETYIDIVAIGLVILRLGSSQHLKEAVSYLCLAIAGAAATAIFESSNHWLLYSDIRLSWGIPVNITDYLMRGPFLRASAAAGHSLSLGYLCAVGLVIYVHYYRTSGLSEPTAKKAGKIGIALLLGGLLAAMSRGPWIVACIGLLVYLGMQKSAAKSTGSFLLGLISAAAVLSLTPLGASILDYLPFVGTVDSGNVDYRSLMNEVGLQLILENPWSGTPNLALRLELAGLKQGQGIVDLLNVYLSFGMAYGIPYLAVFIASILLGLIAYITAVKNEISPENKDFTAALVACLLLHTMLMVTGSWGGPIPAMHIALCCSAIVMQHQSSGESAMNQQTPTPWR